MSQSQKGYNDGFGKSWLNFACSCISIKLSLCIFPSDLRTNASLYFLCQLCYAIRTADTVMAQACWTVQPKWQDFLYTAPTQKRCFRWRNEGLGCLFFNCKYFPTCPLCYRTAKNIYGRSSMLLKPIITKQQAADLICRYDQYLQSPSYPLTRWALPMLCCGTP